MSTTPKEIEVYFGPGISGTIAVPPAASDPLNVLTKGLAPATYKAALIFHGQGGHRNYCYQKNLAHRLATELGIYTLRIDFRGCGYSGENILYEDGRTLSQDVEDIQASAEFMIDGNKNPLGFHFTISSIISHSRGAVAAFLWAVEQEKYARNGGGKLPIIVPNIINCSGRYQSHNVFERYPLGEDDEFYGVEQTMLRYGKFQNVMIQRRELLDLAEADMLVVKQISLDTSVLSIYGLEDKVVNIEDSAIFANELNRGPLSHHLELIPMADHNFFGVDPIETELDAEEFNPLNLPLNSSQLVNYNGLVVDKILDFLQPKKELERFVENSKYVGKVTRWKKVEGVSNFRDVGGWKLLNPRFKSKGTTSVRPNYVFRSAHLGNITPNGLKTLKELGIKVLFDLRSYAEIRRYGNPNDLSSYGIRRVDVPVFKSEDYSPQAIAQRYSNLTASWHTYVNVYDEILTTGSQAFRSVFEHIRDYPTEPFVYHCTAGKDRTGVLSMLILLLVGLDKHTIAKEYELTTFGLKLEYATLKQSYIKLLNKLNALGDLSQMKKVERKDWSLEEQGFDNLMSSRYEVMLDTMEILSTKYEGIVGYLKKTLGFDDAAISRIYYNLVLDIPNGYQPIEWTKGPNL